MAFQIIWSTESEDTLQKVVDYLEEKWTQREIKNFFEHLQKTLHLLEKNPLLFRRSEKQNLHEVLITKHNLLLYQINPDLNRVELLSFFDTRQHPKKKFRKKRN